MAPKNAKKKLQLIKKNSLEKSPKIVSKLVKMDVDDSDSIDDSDGSLDAIVFDSE